MESTICAQCRLPKAPYQCECCQSSICKNCLQTLKKDSFAFLGNIPKDLSFRNYCNSCYDEKVSPALFEYQNNLAKARNVNVFFKTQSEETRLMRRAEKPLKVSDCNDKNETLLRLAFLAAQANFNTLIDVVLTAEKVRMQAYQTTKWSGSGVPLNYDEAKLNRR